MIKNTNKTWAILVLCFLVACTSSRSAIFEQGEKCPPPCWYGIAPGQTSLQEANTILKSIPAVNLTSIENWSVLQPNDSIKFRFLSGFRESDGDFFSQAGIVEAISFGFKPKTLKLSDVLLEWGSPDQYIAIYYSKAEIPYLVTSIIYSKQGIILNSIRNMRPDEIPKFESDFSLQGVWYTDPVSVTSPLKNGTINALNDQDLLDGLKPWVGLASEIQYLKKERYP